MTPPKDKVILDWRGDALPAFMENAVKKMIIVRTVKT